MMWLLVFLVVLIVALLATRAIIALGIADSPDEARKLHKEITPTSGGIGIMIAVVIGVVIVGLQGVLTVTQSVMALVLLSLAGGILGLLDDIYVLGAKLKLLVMLAIVSGFAIFGARIETLEIAPQLTLNLGPILGGLGTVLWLLVLVNTVNFMDGANGMAIGCAAIGLLGLCGLILLHNRAAQVALHFAVLGWIGAAACSGFLYWNAAKGRVFAGDAGALFVGLFCGTFGVLAVVAGVSAFSVALCFLPMLVDVIITIILRLRRRENILTPHSHHAYQGAIRHGASHLRMSSMYWLLTLICCAAALFALAIGGAAPLWIFALMVGVLCCHYWMIFADIRAKSHS